MAWPFDDPRLGELLAERHRDLARRYAGVTDHPADPVEPSEFVPPSGTSLVALADGVPAACGSLRRLEPRVGEIKRMYVGERSRRRGLGRAILAMLESEAVQLGYSSIRLETGVRQDEALAFYQAAGYRPIPCFGRWMDSALSVCYEKGLAAKRP